MKTLRHFGGILLGAVGLLFVVGTVFAPPEAETGMSRSGSIFVFVSLGCFPLVCSAALLKRSIADVRERCCPDCGSDKRAPAGLMLKRANWWAHEFGGSLIASLWGASREKQVRCVQCDALYFTATRGTRIAGILLWIVVLFFVILEVLESLQ